MGAIIQLGGLALLVGFALSLCLTPLSRGLAPSVGLVDHPDERKIHDRPIPASGGLAIFWSFAAPTLVVAWASGALLALFPGGPFAALGDQAPLLTALVAGATLMHATGLIDDLVGLGPLVKLIAQLLASVPLILFFDVFLLPRWLSPLTSVALTLIWFVVVINAFNFLDGMDGLMAAVGGICAAELALIAIYTRQALTAGLLALLTGILLSFLLFNRPPATIFSGDSGSLVVGYLMAFASVRITYADPASVREAPWHAVLAPLLVLAIPLYDLASVVLIRFVQHRSLVAGDNQHFWHRLRRRGLRTPAALLLICAFTLVTGIGGVLLIRLDALQAILIAAQAFVLLLTLALLEWVVQTRTT